MFFAPQAYFQTTKDTIAQKVSNIILHVSLLSRGLGTLGRPASLTLATPEIVWDLAVLQKKIKKMSGGRRGSGRHLWSTGPEVRKTVLGPKSTQEVKNRKLDLAVPRGFYRAPDHF